MSLGKYTELSTLKRHRDHVRLNRLEKENRALRRMNARLEAMNDRLRSRVNSNQLVFESQSRTREQMSRVR